MSGGRGSRVGSSGGADIREAEIQMRRIRVAVYPNRHPNAVIQNLKKVIAAVPGVDVVDFPSWRDACRIAALRGLLRRPAPPLVDVLVLNWPEWLLTDARGRLSGRGAAKFAAKMVLFEKCGRHVIYVRHNRTPHGMTGIDAKLAEKIVDAAAQRCAREVCFSETSDSVTTYVPHPLYQIRADSQAGPGDYFIIFGQIEPRKHIENAIAAWPRGGPELKIAGIASDREYVERLRTLASGQHITFHEGPLPESEAADLVARARALLLTHASAHAFVSGSFFFALSVGTPVFSPPHPYLQHLVESHGFPGVQFYSSIASVLPGLLRYRATPREREHICRAAEHHFGMERCVAAWSALLADILSEPPPCS